MDKAFIARALRVQRQVELERVRECHANGRRVSVGFSEEDIAYMRANAETMGASDMCEALDRTRGTIRNKALQLGIILKGVRV